MTSIFSPTLTRNIANENFDEWDTLPKNQLSEKIEELSQFLIWCPFQREYPEALPSLKEKLSVARLSGDLEEKICKVFQDKLGIDAEFDLRFNRIQQSLENLKYSEKFDEYFQEANRQLGSFSKYLSIVPTSMKKNDVPEILYHTIQQLPCDNHHRTNLVLHVLNMWIGNPTDLQRLRINRVMLGLHQSKDDPVYYVEFEEFIKNWKELADKNVNKQLSDEKWKSILDEVNEVSLFIEDDKKIYEVVGIDVCSIKHQRFLVQYYRFREFFSKSSDDKIFTAKFDYIKSTLSDLAVHYSKKELEKSKWGEIYSLIANSSLRLEKKEELLNIIRETKISIGWIEWGWSWITNIPGLWSDVVKDGEPLWKGDKYLTFLQSLQKWVLDNHSFIQEKLGENQGNSVRLKQKVKELLDFIRDMKLPTLRNFCAEHEKRKEYNESLRRFHQQYMIKLRDIFTISVTQDQIQMYKTLGPDRVSGAMLVLKELCDHHFTGVSFVVFLIKLMKELVPIGLQELSKIDTSYLPDLLRKPNELSLSRQWEAIEALPQLYKGPLKNLLGWKVLNKMGRNWDPHGHGNIPFRLLKLTIIKKGGKEKEVFLQRFATPTNDEVVIPEFRTFLLGKRAIFVSLQKKTKSTTSESKRTDAFLKLNEEQGLSTFFTVNPLSQSSLFHQKNDYADLPDGTSRYNTRVAFFKELMEKIIPSKPGTDLNQPGNYLFPAAWKSSTDFEKLLNDCMKEVNDIFFKDVDVLMQNDRRIFIKLFNVRLAIALIHWVDADIFAFLCNHSADRTGVMVGILLKMLLVMFDKEDKPIYANVENSPKWSELMTIIEVAPLVIAKRALNHNEKGLEDALQIFDNPHVRERLRNHKELFGLKDIEFPFPYIEKEWGADSARQKIEV